MPWFLKPSTWKRLPSTEDSCLIYGSRTSPVIGAIIIVLATIGFIGTAREISRRWPDQELLLVGGLVFSLLVLAIGLSLLLNQHVSINKADGHIVYAWRWLFWHGERIHELLPFDTITFAPKEVPRLRSDDIRRFNVMLTGDEGASLIVFEQVSDDEANKLSDEIAGFLGLRTDRKVE